MADIYWGDTPLRKVNEGGSGTLVVRDDDVFYKISNYHKIPPFFMSIVSGYDHWMFISSTGGLTCGRGNPESALFPYYTEDKIHDACSSTGPQTICLVNRNGKKFLWKPFGQDVNVYQIERNLYKNQVGNKLVFEEVNHDFGLVFTYSWSSSDRFGFVKNSSLRNTGEADLEVTLLDGLRNLLPYGVTRSLQSEMSTLVDAYKQAEAIQDKTAAIYTMSSILTDHAEPSEALKATVVWCNGLEKAKVLLSEDQVDAFCSGSPVTSESFSRGKRGAFFVQSCIKVQPDHEKNWSILADVNKRSSEVEALFDAIDRGALTATIEKDVEAGSQRLIQLVGSADGHQCSSDDLVNGRNFSNTLFNIMRGGTFYDEYGFPLNDFLQFAGKWNKPLHKKFEARLRLKDNTQTLESMLAIAESSNDADMQRLVLEYLPLTFSRRHGDPSRPWNHFSIDIRNTDGSDKLHFQGNWRDIFQNWEALALSYPEFAESFISKFVNASTADGYNPYRITRDGFEWEELNPKDPWSNIGYWGDHQINYLLKLLEVSHRYHPGKIAKYLNLEIFTYADVPYRIGDYQSLLSDPANSFSYDDERAGQIAGRCEEIGSDGKLLTLMNGSVCRASLLEKLLVTMLTKLGNLVPGGGIWMNTRRPEWNDANNALAGYGLSMVTLCYLRRFLVLLTDLLEHDLAEEYSISGEVHSLYTAVEKTLGKFTFMIDSAVRRQDRKRFMGELGLSSEHYRDSVYAGFSGHKSALSKSDLLAFIEMAKAYLEHSIAQNRRQDGLFHSYNLLQIEGDGFQVENLYEMLEGQVAILSSGYLDHRQSLDLLTALRSSKMYRPDQNSYLLYPDRILPLFRDKNVIEPSLLENNHWIQSELASGRDDFIEQDLNGGVHFNGSFRNAKALCTALDERQEISDQDKNSLCEIYESVFNHQQFTGRSGAMYKYEGLGCIYWHMVSKLLLATGETIKSAVENGVNDQQLSSLMEHFDNIRNGLGLHKSPALYGAFTTDAYSHTTGFSGVQQPGLTGQVKEDLIARLYELGVNVEKGEVSFSPVLLRQAEFLSGPKTWHFSVGGKMQSEDLDAGTMAFTLCGVPVIYRLSEHSSIEIHVNQGDPETLSGNHLGATWSQSLFRREKLVRKLVVNLSPNQIRP